MSENQATEAGPNQPGSKFADMALGVAVLLAVAFPVLLVVRAHLTSGGQDGFPLDDPWIHLTFAKNLCESGSFSYYPGQPTTGGSTSPLYVMLLALGFQATSDEKMLSYVFGIFGQIAFLSSFAYWARLRLGGALWAVPAVLLVGFDSRIGVLAVSGMETSMFLAAISIAFVAWIQGRRWVTGTAVGACIWLRPEGLILLGVFAIDLALRRWWDRQPQGQQRPARRSSAPDGRSSIVSKLTAQSGLPLAALLATLYLGFNFLVGGGLLPNTFAAKPAYYSEVPNSLFWIRDVPEAFGSRGWFWLVPFALVGSGLVAWNLLIRRQGNLLRAELGWLLGLTFAYFLILPFSHLYSRYLIPGIPALALLSIYGIQAIATRASTKRSFRWVTVPGIVVLVFLVGPLSKQGIASWAAFGEYAHTCLYHLDRHERPGRWIDENLPGDAVIATHDIGALGFYANRRIVDVVGILDTEAIEHLNGPGYIPYLAELFEREGVTHLALLRNWLQAVNVDPIYVATTEPEIMEVFEWDRDRVHLMPKPAMQLNLQASSLLEANRHDAAVAALRQSLKFDDQSSRTWYLLGITSEMAQQWDEAAAHYLRASELHPTFADAIFRESYVLRRAGRDEDAYDALGRLLRHAPQYPTALDTYMELRSKLGR